MLHLLRNPIADLDQLGFVQAFDWHFVPDSLLRLVPPWLELRIVPLEQVIGLELLELGHHHLVHQESAYQVMVHLESELLV